MVSSFFFYFINSCLIFNVMLAVFSTNIILNVLFLILSFINVSFLLLFFGLEYVGILLIMVYIGAIMVILLFVLLMLNIKNVKIVKNNLFIFTFYILSFIIFFSYITNKWFIYTDLSYYFYSIFVLKK